MTDLKLLGLNAPTLVTTRQADPDSDALLMSNFRPTGGTIPLVITPTAPVTAGNTLFDLQDGVVGLVGTGTSILSVENVAGTFETNINGNLAVSGDLSVTGVASMVSGGPSTILTDMVFGNDDTDTVTFARGWTYNGADFNYSASLILDPNDAPTGVADGSVEILVGAGTANPARGAGG